MSRSLGDLKTELLAPGKAFSVREAQRIVDEIHDQQVIDTDDRFHNQFFHEICPLLVVAKYVGGESAQLSVKGGSCFRFDGLILGETRELDQKIEFTAAKDGWNDAKQVELLSQRGCAPAFQEIQATGNKKNREFGRNETQMIRADVYDQEVLLPLMKSALEKKKKEAQSNMDYVGSWLGIVFDDWVTPFLARKARRLIRCVSK